MSVSGITGGNNHHPPIRGILFDLDDTLRQNDPSTTDTFLDFASEFGLVDTIEKRREFTRWTHLYWAQSADLVEDAAAYPEDEPFWLNYTRRSLQVLSCRPELVETLAVSLRERMLCEHQPADRIPEDVPQTLAELRKAGLRLAVLSNRTTSCNEYLETIGLNTYFDFALVAGEVDSWKPSPQIFRHALQRLGTTAEETLYIGDNYYADILGAQSAGLRPVLIDPTGLFPEADCPVIRSLSELTPLVAAN